MKHRHVGWYAAGAVLLSLVLRHPVSAMEAPAIQWEQTFGGSNTTDRAYEVQETRFGEYIIVGETTPLQSNASSVSLVKTDAHGNMQWERSFRMGYRSRGFSVDVTSDGGYIIVGDGTGVGGYGLDYDVYLIKTDGNGNRQWEKTFGEAPEPDGPHIIDCGYCVRETSDGGYIVTGSTESFEAEHGYPRMYLLKTDGNGTMQWQRTFGVEPASEGRSVRETSDGGYIVTGSTSIQGNMSDVYLVKTNSSGNYEWHRDYGGSRGETGFSAQQTSDGGYVVAGYSSSFPAFTWKGLLLKYDSYGILQWERLYGEDSGFGERDYAYCVRQTRDGGYIVGGLVDYLSGGIGNCWIMKTDTDGITQWEKRYGNLGYSEIQSVQQTWDGGYVAAGCTGPAASSNIYLVKLRPEGWSTLSVRPNWPLYP